MYTPPQWRIAFPLVATAVAMLTGVFVYAWRAGLPFLAGASAGVIAGFLFSIAWAMRRFLPLLSFSFLAIGCLLLAVHFNRPTEGAASAIGLSVLMLGVWVVGYDIVFTRRFHREVISPLERLGTQSAGRALIVYHSAHQGFQRRVQPALAEGLVSQGWQVDITTASVAAPLDIEPYDLIVLGAPSYNWIPAHPVTAYVTRLRDFRGKAVALIVSGGGMTAQAMHRLRSDVE